jgi:hypothetical protein
MTDAATSAFRKSLRGQLIQPDDPQCGGVRALYNGMIDKRPRLIARCLDVPMSSPPSTSAESSASRSRFAAADTMGTASQRR